MTALGASIDIHSTVAARLTAGDPGGALALLEACEALDPPLRRLRAQALLRLDRPREAAADLEAVLRQDPSDPEAVRSLAEARMSQGRTAEVEPLLRRAIQLSPDRPEAWNDLGNLLRSRSRGEEAESAFARALEIDPGYVEAINNMATLRLDRGDAATAASLLHKAVTLAPRVAALHSNLGNALRALDDLDGAEAAYRRAVGCDPGFAGGWYNLARMLRLKGCLAESADTALRAVQLAPGLAAAWNARGIALHEQGALDAAAAAYGEAIRLRPDFAEARWNLGMNRLLAGDFTQGWPLYEWRRRVPSAPPRRSTLPDWTGGTLVGRRLLVLAEQGLGDLLMTARFIPRLAAAGARVLLETPPSLAPLFQRLSGVEACFPADDPLPPADAQVAIASLPGLVGVGVGDTIAASVPYLSPDPELVAYWAGKLASLPRPRVGLVWAGNPKFRDDRWRSPGLAAMAPILALPGISFVSLQMGEGRAMLASSPLAAGLCDLGPSIADFGDTAAILANLDLLISSCTAPVHLAGGLGRPVWVLLQHVPDWRWGLTGSHSSWYPTARLYRQERRGDWTAPVARIAADLADFAAPIRRGALDNAAKDVFPPSHPKNSGRHSSKGDGPCPPVRSA